jgi:hypothetical protein
MPKIPNAKPVEARCDPRLPEAALDSYVFIVKQKYFNNRKVDHAAFNRRTMFSMAWSAL